MSSYDRPPWVWPLFSSAISALRACRARPLRIAHREGNLLRQSSPGVYELAASIGGLRGIEVRTMCSKLWGKEVALAHKRESLRWNMPTVSMGGLMPQADLS